MIFTKLDPDATAPARAHHGDAGIDLFSCEMVDIPAGEHRLVGTGIAVAIIHGQVGLICPRSGLAARHGVTVLNAPGVIDSGYRGEVKVLLANHSDVDYLVGFGDKIAQLVLVACFMSGVHEGELPPPFDGRGTAGFGSTGT